MDHVTHKSKGGSDTLANYLAACSDCDGLRWNRSGHSVRKLIRIGKIAKGRIKSNAKVGKRLLSLQKGQKATNRARRAKRTTDA